MILKPAKRKDYCMYWEGERESTVNHRALWCFLIFCVWRKSYCKGDKIRLVTHPSKPYQDPGIFSVSIRMLLSNGCQIWPKMPDFSLVRFLLLHSGCIRWAVVRGCATAAPWLCWEARQPMKSHNQDNFHAGIFQKGFHTKGQRTMAFSDALIDLHIITKEI